MLKSLFGKSKKFQSRDYWESRYRTGGNSGAGSYNHLAAFKADVINNLIQEHTIKSAIEFGCGDGNQLASLKCDKYIGLDVSVAALEICHNKFGVDNTKSFFLYHHKGFIDNHRIFQCDASMSLDVLYHLVEKEVYDAYLNDLFRSASKLVIIYGADMDLPQQSAHELYRKFTIDIERKFTNWKLATTIKNKYPAKNYEDQEGSLADFYIYTRV